MNEFEKLYTVDDIANMTSLTSRTIRNYLKDGSLQGKKIGGQWRFTMEDIKRLFDNSSFSKEITDSKKQEVFDFIEGVNTDIKGKVQVCTIADYYFDEQNEAKLLCDKLISICNNPDNKFNMTKFSYEVIDKEKKARFTLFGPPDYIIKMLEAIK